MERAFDLTRYQEFSSFNLRALENDTPALAVESSSNKPVEKRVWRVVEALWNGRVVQRKTSKERDVLSFYADKTETQRKEKEAGRKMRQFLLESPDNSVFAWISPPGGGEENQYQEGRIRIGVKKTKLGIPVVETYGIPVVGATPEDCFYQYIQLEEHAKKTVRVDTPEDIRDKILVFDTQGQGLWFLEDKTSETIIPKAVWDAIQTGQTVKENAQVARLAKVVIDSQKRSLDEAIRSGDEKQVVLAGARIESELIRLGFNIQKGTCGLLNTDLIKILNNPLVEKTLAFTMVQREKWSYEPGYCRKPPHGCGFYKSEVGPCGFCKNCEKKYS